MAIVDALIPALNEEESLPGVLRGLQGRGLRRIYVVDNGSTDRTAEVAEAGGAVVVHCPKRGYGSACLAGLRRMASDPPEVVVFLDADGADDPDDLPALLSPIESRGAEMVIGSRVLGGATMEALLPQAWFGNRLACFLMWLLFGARHTDLGPFRALTAAALERLEMGDETFGWTIEMQLKAHTRGLAVTEVPVRYRARIGSSKITGTLAGTLGAARKILGWIFGYRLATWLGRR